MIRTLFVMAVGSLALASPSLAQNFNGNISNENVELIPFIGYRTGGSLSGQVENTVRDFGIKSDASYGGVIDVSLHQGNFKLEALYSRQSTEINGAGLLVPSGLNVDVEYLQGASCRRAEARGALLHLGAPRRHALQAGGVRLGDEVLDQPWRRAEALSVSPRGPPFRGPGLPDLRERGLGRRLPQRDLLLHLVRLASLAGGLHRGPDPGVLAKRG